MGAFSDILITADFDRTLTAPDSTIPERNLEAIRYFIDNGGAFTVNTGRSVPMAKVFRDIVPVNAPLLLYNGSAAYDLEKKDFTFCHLIDLNMEEVLRRTIRDYPDMTVEIQGFDAHNIFQDNPDWVEFSVKNSCAWRIAKLGQDIGPFIKMSVYGKIREPNVSHLFSGTPEEIARIDEVEAALRETYQGKMQIIRVAPRIIDIHAPGVSKGKAARRLQQQLGRKILVCAGDGLNDLTMMDEADYSYCPADGAIAKQYENVCRCADGAVADVIYKKIPEILKKQT